MRNENKETTKGKKQEKSEAQKLHRPTPGSCRAKTKTKRKKIGKNAWAGLFAATEAGADNCDFMCKKCRARKGPFGSASL
jgi:hypothetical protein